MAGILCYRSVRNRQVGSRFTEDASGGDSGCRQGLNDNVPAGRLVFPLDTEGKSSSR
jgi:hypothetical protein